MYQLDGGITDVPAGISSKLKIATDGNAQNHFGEQFSTLNVETTYISATTLRIKVEIFFSFMEIKPRDKILGNEQVAVEQNQKYCFGNAFEVCDQSFHVIYHKCLIVSLIHFSWLKNGGVWWTVFSITF